MGILIVLIFFAVAWVLLILPRQRELRRHQALMTELEPGDEVIMSSGVYGTIRDIEGDMVQLEVAPGVELKIAKRAVAAKVVEPESDDASVVDLTEEDVADSGPTSPDRPDTTGT